MHWSYDLNLAKNSTDLAGLNFTALTARNSITSGEATSKMNVARNTHRDTHQQVNRHRARLSYLHSRLWMNWTKLKLPLTFRFLIDYNLSLCTAIHINKFFGFTNVCNWGARYALNEWNEFCGTHNILFSFCWSFFFTSFFGYSFSLNHFFSLFLFIFTYYMISAQHAPLKCNYVQLFTD